MNNRKRTLSQALQVLAAAVLAVVIFIIWNDKKPSQKENAPEDTVRTVTLLDKGWQFHKGDSSEVWEDVTIPHDWAIYGPFSRDNDLQTVAVVQNGEETATVKTGYGYNSFHCDITPFLTADGKNNEIRVRLENRPQSSRWYPGAGLYRNVWLIETEKVHIPVWGTYITTELDPSLLEASVNIRTEIEGITTEQTVALITVIRDANGRFITSIESLTGAEQAAAEGGIAVLNQKVTVDQPRLWFPETPELYTAYSRIYVQDNDGNRTLSDFHATTFGIRSIEVRPETGFYLNGVNRKFPCATS